MKNDVYRSTLWSGIQQAVTLSIQFGVGLVLARMLNPYDFGVVAMQGVFFAICGTIVGCGLESALIQKRECGKEDESTVFIFTTTVSIFLYVMLFFAAPLIADFFHHENLQKVVRVSAVVLILDAIGIVPRSLLQRRLQFKELAFITTTVSVTTGILAILMAYNGLGYWALVGQTLLAAVLMTMAYYVRSRWQPLAKFSNESFRQLINFGLPMMFTGLVNAIYINLYPLIIGRYYTPSQLGVYNRAQSYGGFLPYNLSDASMRALYPIISKAQDNIALLKRQGMDILHVLMFLVVPIITCLTATADDLIRILLTEKWMNMAPLMQVLCVAGLGYVINNLHVNMFKAVGKTHVLFICEMLKKGMGVLALLVTFRYGLMAMAWGVLAGTVMSVLVSSVFLWRFLGVTLMDQFRQVYIVVGNALLALLVCMVLGSITDIAGLRLIICLLGYVSIYGLLSFVVRDRAIGLLKGYLG